MKITTHLLALLALVTTASSKELLENFGFELYDLRWHVLMKDGLRDRISFETHNLSEGLDATFNLGSGGYNTYDAQMIQTRLRVRPRHQYKMTIRGMSTSDGRKSLSIGIQHNGGSPVLYGDLSDTWTVYDSLGVTLPAGDYGTFSRTWDNCSETDSIVQFFIHAGGDDKDAYVSWVSLDESPINCGPGNTDAAVRMNQVGLVNNGAKTAVVLAGTNDSIEVRDASGKTVLTRSLLAQKTWSASREKPRLVDLSALHNTGTYTLHQGGSQISRPFTVAPDVFEPLLKASLKFFYYQRASSSIISPFAGRFPREAGQLDNRVSRSLAGQTGSINCSRGWYDDGDYGKSVVNSGLTTYTLLSLYEHYSGYFDRLTWNLMESSNGIADLLDEIKWNLDWLLNMQDRADGGVYHKLTAKTGTALVMPAADTTTRYLFMKTTNAALNFSAIMASASRIYAKSDAAFAATCLAASRRAYTWATDNPTTYFVQPTEVTTAAYRDTVAFDEKFWAATELYLATREAPYLADLQAANITAGMPDWSSVGMLGYATIAFHPDAFVQDAPRAKDSIVRLARNLRDSTVTSGYAIPMTIDNFSWNSNATAANQGILLLEAFYLTKDSSYWDAALQAHNYLLGQNPLDMSFVTGFGSESPMNPRHRPSIADNIWEPIPGMLVQGPNGSFVDSKMTECPHYASGLSPAMAYLDYTCSYATNEVSIGTNATFAYLTGSIQALSKGYEFMEPGHIPVATRAGDHAAPTPRTQLVYNGKHLRVQKRNAQGTVVRELTLDGRAP